MNRWIASFSDDPRATPLLSDPRTGYYTPLGAPHAGSLENRQPGNSVSNITFGSSGRERDSYQHLSQFPESLQKFRGYGGAQTRLERGLLCFSNSIAKVSQDKIFAAEHFGEFDRILGPGLAVLGFDLCGCCISLRSVSTRVEQILVDVQTKTRDHVFVTASMSVQLSVDLNAVYDAMYRLSDAYVQVESEVANSMRSTLARMSLKECYEQMDMLSNSVRMRITPEMAQYGFLVHGVLVADLRTDPGVESSMCELSKRRYMLESASIEADKNKMRTLRAAEADADAAHIHGLGIAKEYGAIVNGLVESMGQPLNPQTLIELLLVTQQFETLRQVAGSEKANIVMFPNECYGPSDVEVSLVAKETSPVKDVEPSVEQSPVSPLKPQQHHMDSSSLAEP